MTNHAELASHCPESDLQILRELLSYDMLCESSCTFVRNQFNTLGFAYEPSPMHWSRQVEWPWAIRMAELEPSHRCLDIGSGWSVLKYAIARRCESLQCLDSEWDSLTKATQTTDVIRRRFIDERLRGVGHNISQVCADARSLPFASETFDRVFCISVIEHVSGDRWKCFEEMLRVLKPGGMALVTMDIADNGHAGSGNFYMEETEAASYLMRFGITEGLVCGPVLSAQMREEKMSVRVLMMRVVKQ